MTSFVESCIVQTAGSAIAVERESRHRPRARKLVKLLADKRNILVTAHKHPDPDALASSYGIARLLRMTLPNAAVTTSVKGIVGGGYNEAFLKQNDIKLKPWDDGKLAGYDAILLMDVQPMFKLSPLPEGVVPTAVIDHHRSRGRKPKCDFCDIRTDVGATSSIVFSYYMELEVPIPPDLAATLLFAIETDLAGAAGQPGELDNVALSSLTLMADTRKLYKMRYAQLPRSIYVACYDGLANALQYDTVVVSHLPQLHSPESPAIMADFLLRFERSQWALVTAVNGDLLTMSMRTNSQLSAADVLRRVIGHMGEGGGHRTKAGGSIQLKNPSDAAEIERIRKVLLKRLLAVAGVEGAKGVRVVPGQG